MNGAGEALRNENVAVIAYPNGLGTTTIIGLTVAEFISLQDLISKIPDSRCVDVSDNNTVDSGIMSLLDKIRERRLFAGWRQRMTKLGIDPDATYSQM